MTTDQPEPLTETLIEDAGWRGVGLGQLAETAAVATLAHLGLPRTGYTISVLGSSDAEITRLNSDFRDKLRPTNVLSWPSANRDPAAPPRAGSPGHPTELGDIAIAYGTCRREAEAAGLALADHATHLMVHAVLHLLGYDHQEDDEAELMETTESAILVGMGLKDPYL